MPLQRSIIPMIQHLFPLLYLLLKRDFEIMRIAQHTVLHKDELWDSANTIEWVFQAVGERHRNLESKSITIMHGLILVDS